MTVMSVDHLHDMDMLDGAGQRIGSVKDLLIDASTGQMRFVVVAPGQGGIAGALGIGERLVAIPFAVVRLESGQMLLARDAAALAAAPAFTRSHPPGFDEAYEQELARYWDAEVPEDLEAAAVARLTAGSILSSQLPSVTASAGLRAVARTLAGNQVEAAQVVDDEGKVIGVVTLRDVALALGQGGRPGAPGAGVRAAQAETIDVARVQAQEPEPAAPADQAPGAGAIATTETGADAAASPPAASPPAAAMPPMGEQGAAAPTTQPRGQGENARQESDAVPCPNCGRANRPTATFCAACGTRLR